MIFYIFVIISAPKTVIIKTVPISTNILRIFTAFSTIIFDKIKNIPIPITPPNVFPIKSVISLAPIAKTY